ncbi:MAG: circadian clock KaiB family protein [Ignavibacteria bacterium]
MRREAQYHLRLYVTDHTLRSRQALAQLQRLCDEQLPDRYELEVVDVLTCPEEAKAHRILATPTVEKLLPHPMRRIIGDLADIDKVLAGLELHPAKAEVEE